MPPADTPSFFLHGYGSSAELFRAIWTAEGRAMEGSDTFMDGAEHDRLTGRRRWFAFSGKDDRLAEAVRRATDRAEASIACHLQSEGRALETPIRLFGHSQGGMIALELVRRRFLTIASADCFASYLPEGCGDTARPPCGTSVALYSSRADRFVTRVSVRHTVERMKSAGIDRIRDMVADTLSHEFCAQWLQPDRFKEVRDGS